MAWNRMNTAVFSPRTTLEPMLSKRLCDHRPRSVTNDMSSVFESRWISLPSSPLRVRRAARYGLGALALIVAMIAYCELCSMAWGLPAPGLKVSAPWALQVSLGWILAGAALGMFGARIADSELAARRPRATIVAAAFIVAAFVLVCEIFVLQWRSDHRNLFLFVYQRSLVLLAASTVLIGIYVGERALCRRRTAATTVAHTEKSDALEGTDTIQVMTGTGHTVVRISEIECLQADRNYINVIHTSGRIYLLRQTMGAAEALLDPERFVRIHRSTIINRHMVKERRAKGMLLMQSGRTVAISRAFRDRVHQILSG